MTNSLVNIMVGVVFGGCFVIVYRYSRRMMYKSFIGSIQSKPNLTRLQWQMALIELFSGALACLALVPVMAFSRCANNRQMFLQLWAIGLVAGMMAAAAVWSKSEDRL